MGVLGSEIALETTDVDDVVDTVFCTCQNDQSGLIGRGKLLCALTADENQPVKMVVDEWW